MFQFKSKRNPWYDRTPRVFINDEDADEWGQIIWGDWFHALSQDDKLAIQHYCGNYFRKMNSTLRQEKHLENVEHVLELCRQLSSTLQNAPRIPEPLKVYRFISEDCYKTICRNRELKDSAFQSCTLVAPTSPFRGSYCLRFTLPEGTVGAYVEPISRRREECELLLPSFNYRYRFIRKKHERELDIIFVDCEVDIQPK